MQVTPLKGHLTNVTQLFSMLAIGKTASILLNLKEPLFLRVLHKTFKIHCGCSSYFHFSPLICGLFYVCENKL